MRAREYFCLSFPCIHDLRSCERHRIQIERGNTYNILVIVQKLTLAFMNAGYLGSARAKSRLVTVQIDKMGNHAFPYQTIFFHLRKRITAWDFIRKIQPA